MLERWLKERRRRKGGALEPAGEFAYLLCYHPYRLFLLDWFQFSLQPSIPDFLSFSPHPHNWNSLLKNWKGLSHPFCPVSCGHRKLYLAGEAEQIRAPVQPGVSSESLRFITKMYFTSREVRKEQAGRVVSLCQSSVEFAVWKFLIPALVCVCEFKGWNRWAWLFALFLGLVEECGHNVWLRRLERSRWSHLVCNEACPVVRATSAFKPPTSKPAFWKEKLSTSPHLKLLRDVRKLS